MHKQRFFDAFEQMRQQNLGKQFERRELGLLASQHGIYFNPTMWICGLAQLFNVGKVGPKYVYSFKPRPLQMQDVADLYERIRVYRADPAHKIAYAKAILRRYGVRVD